MADRVGVIHKGEIILVEDKAELMRKLGKKQLALHLHRKLDAVPPELAAHRLELKSDGSELIYSYDTQGERTGITLLQDLNRAGIGFRDLHTTQSSLEDIFVDLVRQEDESAGGPCDLRFRDVAHHAHASAERRLAGDLDLAVLRRVRRRDRLAHHRDRRVSYGAFIVPGLIMLMLLTQSVSNASFGIYFPKFTGTIFEILSAPVSYLEIVIGYVGAAATKSIVLGLIILATSWLFVPIRIAHPGWMLGFLVLTAVTFSLLGFIIGIWADGFEKLQVVLLLIVTPLTFLGGSFYPLSVLPPVWQTISLFNPVVYLVAASAGAFSTSRTWRWGSASA